MRQKQTVVTFSAKIAIISDFNRIKKRKYESLTDENTL